jgi:hypothetical protein
MYFINTWDQSVVFYSFSFRYHTRHGIVFEKTHIAGCTLYAATIFTTFNLRTKHGGYILCYISWFEVTTCCHCTMRRSRRKTEPAKPAQLPTVTPQTEANGNGNPPNVQKMQVSEQEASLTAKNYRLAKELVSLLIIE